MLVGLDGGGTHTRVLVCDLDGRFRGHGQAGGCHPGRRPWPECLANVRQALAAAVPPGQPVAAFVGGLAGAHYLPAGAGKALVEGLRLQREPVLVWDNRIALAGALDHEPGIVACAGTGSVVYGLTEGGSEVRCTEFGVDTRASAWALTIALLPRFESLGDDQLRGAVMAALGLPDADAVRALSRALEERRPTRVDLGSAAPAITGAADRGVPEAQGICDGAAARLAHGCRLLAPRFARRPVPVAPAGGVALSTYMMRALRAALGGETAHVRFTPPRYPALVGAVSLAARHADRRLAPAACRELAAAVTQAGP